MKSGFFNFAAAAALVCAGCNLWTNAPQDRPPVPAAAGTTITVTDPAGFDKVMSSIGRSPAESAPAQDVAALVRGNNDFAFNLYRRIAGADKNCFYSPYSISAALAMTWAGARGETQSQMETALCFSLPQERLHPAFNALDLGLTVKTTDTATFALSIANALWAQKDFAIEGQYLDIMTADYGAGMNLLDFIRFPDPSRIVINTWVSNRTNDRINDLIPQGLITSGTRLVLTNAIWFKAKWADPFEMSSTHDGIFNLAEGDSISTPFMNKRAEPMPFFKGEGYSAVELAYAGGTMSMIVILPDPDRMREVETGLNAASLAGLSNGLVVQPVSLSLPKFSFTAEGVSLKNVLSELGMPVAFTGAADFTGISSTEPLQIGDVIHKAFVAVAEEGTEAAAATAVVMVTTSMPIGTPVNFTADRPFIFIIRDRDSGSILFAGKIANPSE